MEELALQSMIGASEEKVPVPLPALAEDTQQVRGSLGWEVPAWAQLALCGFPPVTSLMFSSLQSSPVKCLLCCWFDSRLSPFAIPKSSTVFPGGLGNTCVVWLQFTIHEILFLIFVALVHRYCSFSLST